MVDPAVAHRSDVGGVVGAEKPLTTAASLLVSSAALLASASPPEDALEARGGTSFRARVDPFGGSGTTYDVCERKRRHWIGMDMESSDVIRERLETPDLHYHRNTDVLDLG